MRSGILFLVSGPSGSGKSTLCRRISSEGEAEFSVSCTTRRPREGEVDGDDYHFLGRDEFERRIRGGEFLEYAEVHGNFYGTLRSEVTARIAAGHDVVMDIDVQGAAKVRAIGDWAIRRALVDIFVMPPNEAELEARLRGRATDDEETIQLRLRNAIEEMAHWRDYTFRLISSTREEDYANFRSLLVAERMRISRIKDA